MKRFLAGWGAVLLAYQLPLSAETLTVQVSGIKDPGEIHIAIYDSAEAFEGDKGEKGGPAEGIVDGVVEEAQPGSVTYTFELPQGRYAIGVFHDANRNNRSGYWALWDSQRAVRFQQRCIRAIWPSLLC